MSNLLSINERKVIAVRQLDVWRAGVNKALRNIEYSHEVWDMDMSEEWQEKLKNAEMHVKYYEQELKLLNNGE